MTNTATPLKVNVHLCGEGRGFDVTFAPGTDAVAAAYLAARVSYCAMEVDEDANLDAWPLTFATLFPECEHGLSLTLCAGPDHYPMSF